MAFGYKTGGRTRGTPNKTTVALKTAILNAFEKAGGEDYLVRIAKDDPRTFCSLLGKVLPAELRATVIGDREAELREASPEQLYASVQALVRKGRGGEEDPGIAA